MSKLILGDFLSEKEYQDKEKQEQKIIEDFFSSKEIEVDEGYKDWEKEIANSSNPQEIVLNKLKEKISIEDSKCIDSIIQILTEEPEKHTDIIYLENKLKKDFPDINPIAIFQFTMLLMGIGIIKLEK